MADSLIADTARRIFADLADPQTVNRAKDDGWKAPLWKALEEAGLTVAWAPEAQGGAGAELMDGFDILRICGQYAAPAPVAETLVAAWALARAGLEVPSGPMTVAPVREHDRLAIEGGRVSGRARAVPFAKGAERVVALAFEGGEARVALLRASDARVSERAANLGAERADLEFEGVEALAVGQGCTAEEFRMLGAVARVQQMAGALETVLHLSSGYAQERVAFGRPIGKFQAVQQNLARLAGEVAAALTAASSSADTMRGALAGEVPEEDLFLEAASAKIRAGEAANEGAAIAHQAHGAIGFTDEYVLQRFTRSLFGWRDDFGPEAVWAVALGTRVAAAGADALWPALTRR